MTDADRVRESLRTYVKLLRAGKAVLARVEPLLAAEGLTPTQLGVLEAILHKGPLSQRQLVRKVLTSAGNMTDVIDKLAARGLLSRQRSMADRRAVSVALTPAGQALIEDLFPRHAADIAQTMSDLTPAELQELGRLLRKLGLAAAGGGGGSLAAAAGDGTPLVAPLAGGDAAA